MALTFKEKPETKREHTIYAQSRASTLDDIINIIQQIPSKDKHNKLTYRRRVLQALVELRKESEHALLTAKMNEWIVLDW